MSSIGILGLINPVTDMRPRSFFENLIRVWARRGLVLFVGASLPMGCATRVYDGESLSSDETKTVRIFMPPFFNATNDDHAGRALTELTGSALVERGIPLYQTEALLLSSQEESSAGTDGRYQDLAQSVGATHLLIGTVHEYRYKTDLDGDPAVGITIRIVDAEDGRTVWQGSSSNIGYAFASLTSASQRAVRRLVGRLPLNAEDYQSAAVLVDENATGESLSIVSESEAVPSTINKDTSDE